MNKKLLALAVAGALAAPGIAVAQASNVQLYGLMDMTLMNVRYSGNATGTISGVRKWDLYNSGPSYLGVRGSEDLGNGLKAWFQTELTVMADGRPDNFAVPASFFGSRNTGLGLEGSWGKTVFGFWDTPYKVANLQTWLRGSVGPTYHGGMIMGNGDTSGATPSAQCANGITAAGTATAAVAGPTNASATPCGNQVEASATPFHRRLSNTVQYWSPTWAGFQGRVATQINESKTPSTTGANPDPSLWSYGLTWRGGPWNAGLAYETHKGFSGTTASSDPNVKDTALMIGGGWNFGMGSVGIGFEQLKYGDNTAPAAAPNDYKRKNWVINAEFKVGANGLIFAGYSKTPGGTSCGAGATTAVGGAVCGSNAAASFSSLGYQHTLSKRSSLYAVYSRINNGAGTGYHYIAGPNVPATGAAGGLSAGTDVTAIGAGMRHTF